jgi:hypothetical protein
MSQRNFGEHKKAWGDEYLYHLKIHLLDINPQVGWLCHFGATAPLRRSDGSPVVCLKSLR